MPPKRLTRKSIYTECPELQNLPRRKLVSLIKRIKLACDSGDVSMIGSHHEKSLDEQLHRHFDNCARKEIFDGFAMEFADPGLLVQHILAQCPRLAQRWALALQEPCAATVSNPWHCIVGFDEFNPGDKFSFDMAKAAMCLYINFIEVDHASQGCTWFRLQGLGFGQG